MIRGVSSSTIVLGFALLCFSLADVADAQQSPNPKRIGVLAVSVSEQSEEAKAFRDALREAGYREGRDISIEWWFGEGRYNHVSEAAARMVQREPDVIVVESTPAALAAKRATNKIPIVLALVSDPVGSGLVGRLSNPTGNITGLTNQTVDLAAKRLQLLKEAIPAARRVMVIFNPETPPNKVMISRLKEAAPAVGLALKFTSVRDVDELRSAFVPLSRSSVDAVFIVDDASMTTLGEEFLHLGMRIPLPIVYAHTPLARSGVLLSYAVNHPELFRRAAKYVDKILKGANPAELPIEQPTKFELVINLKTAKLLNLTIPESILIRADEVVR